MQITQNRGIALKDQEGSILFFSSNFFNFSFQGNVIFIKDKQTGKTESYLLERFLEINDGMEVFQIKSIKEMI